MFIKGIFIPRSIRLTVEGDTTPPGGGTDFNKVLDSFNSRLAKHSNDATALAQQLFGENHDLREDKRKLKAKVTELEGKQPGEGGIVLSGDDAKAWGSIKELNLTADQIKQKLQTSTDMEAELSGLKRKELMRQISEVEGYKATVLETLLKPDAAIEIKEIEKDGQKRKAAFIKYKENGGDKESPLSEYIESNHADFLPALKVESANTTTFVRQDSKGKAPSANPYDRIREDTKKRQEAQKTDTKSLDQRLGMTS